MSETYVAELTFGPFTYVTATESGTGVKRKYLIIGVAGGGDVTAPILTLPTGVQTGSGTATIGATTNEGNGTLFGVVTTTVNTPTAAQIKLGQNHLGAAAVAVGSVAVLSTGAKTINVTGLVASTPYYTHLAHFDAALNPSNVVDSTQFTTDPSGGALATPTLTRQSGDAAGSAPLNLEMSWTPPSGESAVGYFRWLRFYSDVGLTTLTQSIVDQIDAEEYANNLSTMGFTTPSGFLAVTLTMLRENEVSGATTVSGAKDPAGNTIPDFKVDASAASIAYTDTISATSSVWATGASDKSNFVTLSNGNLTVTGIDTGAINGVRSDHNATGKRYLEYNIDAYGATAPNFVVGVIDATTSLGPSVFGVWPGDSGSADGASFKLYNGSTAVGTASNGGQSSVTLSTVLTTNDKVGVEFDTTANTVSLYHKPGAGAWYLVTTLTMTSKIPAAFRAFFGCFRGGDQTTTNFGATTFSKTLSSGYQGMP